LHELMCGELAALIRVYNLRLAMVIQCLLQAGKRPTATT
jgi:hypothetical protein